CLSPSSCTPPLPRPPPFPYTTLFRSLHAGCFPLQRAGGDEPHLQRGRHHQHPQFLEPHAEPPGGKHPAVPGLGHGRMFAPWRFRSEEHTSELQSRENLVCRLTLEKKK